jgi:hypothetical protein
MILEFLIICFLCAGVSGVGIQLKEWGAALSRAWPERDRTQRDLREAKKKHAALEVKARDATDDAAAAIKYAV